MITVLPGQTTAMAGQSFSAGAAAELIVRLPEDTTAYLPFDRASGTVEFEGIQTAEVGALGALGEAPEGLGGAVGVVAPHPDKESRHTPAKTVRHDTIDSTSSVRDALIPLEMMSPGGKIAAGARFAFPAWAPGKLRMTT